MSILGLVVVILVLCLLWWCANRLMTVFGLDPKIRVVVEVFLVLVFCLYILQSFGVVAIGDLRLH
jgi:hypothetical protein